MSTDDIVECALLVGGEYGWGLPADRFDEITRRVLTPYEHLRYGTRIWANYLLLRAERPR